MLHSSHLKARRNKTVLSLRLKYSWDYNIVSCRMFSFSDLGTQARQNIVGSIVVHLLVLLRQSKLISSNIRAPCWCVCGSPRNRRR